MKIKYYHIILLAFVSLSFLTCERDDLCDEDTPTTPRMIIEFRDSLIPENTKTVTGLRVEDADDDTRFLEDYNAEDSLEMILPLKTDAEETKYVVYEDYNIDDNGTPDDDTDDFQTGNPDTITITYETEDVYVSRACGFKTTFTNVMVTIEPAEPGEINWMVSEDSTNINQSILNEDETHWTIRH